eukprot:4763508-Prymnesium_polylepis.1
MRVESVASKFKILHRVWSGTEEYELVRIIDRRVVDRQVQYLAEWKGYGVEDWQPVSARHSLDCNALACAPEAALPRVSLSLSHDSQLPSRASLALPYGRSLTST